MTWFKTLAAATLLQAAFLLPATAGENLAAIQSAGVFKIGTEGTYAPFTYHDADGKLVGFDVEIGEEVAKRLGVKAEFLEGKWDGLIAGLDAPTTGQILIDGIDITRLGEDALARLRGDKIGFVFQFFHLIPSLTARENELVPMELAGRRDAGPRARDRTLGR